jgi:hypothetical protein
MLGTRHVYKVVHAVHNRVHRGKHESKCRYVQLRCTYCVHTCTYLQKEEEELPYQRCMPLMFILDVSLSQKNTAVKPYEALRACIAWVIQSLTRLLPS